MKKDFRISVMILFNLLIIIANAFLYWAIWSIFYKFNIVEPFYEKGTILLVVLYSVILTSLTSLYGGYKVGLHRVREIIYSHTIALSFTNAITYIQVSLIARDMLNVLPILLLTLVQLALAIAWAYTANRNYVDMHPPLRTMIIYSGGNITGFLEKIKTREDRYSVLDIYCVGSREEDLFGVIQGKNIQAVFIQDVNNERRSEIIKYCFYNSVQIFASPSLPDILTKSSELFNLFEVPLFVFNNSEISLGTALLKRTLDIVLSSILIAISIPVLIVIGLLIKLEDKGPITIKQNRLTKDNKVFEMIKIRSMVESAEDDGVARLAAKDDQRVTRVGKFIRRFRLDEIPQFINIIKGDMSLVGPRPERPEIAEEYVKTIPEFAGRTRVKAGLTGYAQLMGTYDTSPEDKLKLDLYYIVNYSTVQDLFLIVMTLRRLVNKE